MIKKTLQLISRIWTKGSFAQNVLIVFSGNSLSFLIRLILTPIISRIFGPEAYGEFAFYNLIITNIGFIGAMSLPTVFVLPKTKLEFFALAKIVLFGVLFLILLSLLVFLFFEGFLFDYQGVFYSVPVICIVIILVQTNGVFVAWNQRAKKFRKLTQVNLASNIVSRIFLIIIGKIWINTGSGLIFGEAVRAIIMFFFQVPGKIRGAFFRFIVKDNWKYTIEIFKKNINVPKFIFPSQVLNKLTSDLPILIIGTLYGKASLGYYTFTVSLLNIPIDLVSSSIRPVFYQKANELFSENADPHAIGFLVKKIMYLALGFTFIPLILISAWAPELFKFFFGAEWVRSGELTSLIVFQYLMSAISSSMQGIRRIIGLERRIFIIVIIGTIVKLIPLAFAFMNMEFETFIFLNAVISSLFISLSLSDLFFSIMPWKKALFQSLILHCFLTIGLIIGYQI